MIKYSALLLITAFFSPLAVAEEPLPNPQALNQESLEGEPTIFREVGTYRITKSVLVSLGNCLLYTSPSPRDRG